MLERVIELATRYPLDFACHFAILVTALVGLWRWRGLDTALNLVVLYFGIHFIKECILLWYSIHRIHSIHILNFFSILDILLIGGIYIAALGQYKRQMIVTIALLLSIISSFYFRSDIFSDISNTIYRIFAFFIVLLYYQRLIARMEVKNIFLHGMFWVSSGLLIYVAGTLFVFLFSNIVLNVNTSEDNEFDLYWNVNQVLYIFFCLTSIVGFWVNKHDRRIGRNVS